MKELIEQLNKLLENYIELRNIRATTLFVDRGFNKNIDDVLSNIEKSIDIVCEELNKLCEVKEYKEMS